MPSRTCLALLALLPLTLLGCSGPGMEIKTGNMVVTLAPKSLSGPTFLVTYDSGSRDVFTAYLDASDGSFEIQGEDGWYGLEDVTEITVQSTSAEDQIELTDSTGVLVALASVVTKMEDEFVSNSATGDWYAYDPLEDLHKFAIYILFKDSIHVIQVRAKG